jgi:putative SOS response-associated peptidase YedK
MCGRFVSPEEAAIERYWHVGARNPLRWWSEDAHHNRNYDVRPTNKILLVRTGPTIEVTEARWGFVPFWWKQEKPPTNTINARSEEAAVKPMWRDAYRKSRCLIPARGWYEWRREEQADPETGELKIVNQRYYMRRKDMELISFAGLLSDQGQDSDGLPALTCTILTRAASGPVGQVHERMPVIFTNAANESWLDPATSDAIKVTEMIRDGLQEDFELIRVGSSGLIPADDTG